MDNNEKIKTKHNSRNLNNKYTHIVIKNTYIHTYIHIYTYIRQYRMSFVNNNNYNTSPQTNYTELNNSNNNNMSYGSGSSSNNYNNNSRRGNYGGNDNEAYENLMEDVKRNLKTFSDNINNITRLSKKIGKRDDSESLRQDIRININSAKDIVTRMSTQLKQLNEFNKKVTGSEKSSRRSRQRKLMRDFQALVKNYEISSQKAIKLDDNNPLRHRSSSGYGGNNNNNNSNNNNNNSIDFRKGGNGPIEWTGNDSFDNDGEQQHLLAHEQALNQEIIEDRHNAM